VFEHLSWIMSLEGLCYAVYDQPDLVKAVADKLGELMAGFYYHLLDLDRLVVVFPGDDMGFRSGTLVHPDALRRYCLPWHKAVRRNGPREGDPVLPPFVREPADHHG